MTGWRTIREPDPYEAEFEHVVALASAAAVREHRDREADVEMRRLAVTARHGAELADVILAASEPLDLDNVADAPARDERLEDRIEALVASATRPRGRRLRCDVVNRRATLVASGAPVPWPMVEVALRRRGWLV